MIRKYNIINKNYNICEYRNQSLELSKNSKKTPFSISWLWDKLHNNLILKVFPNITGWDKGVVDIPYAVTVA